MCLGKLFFTNAEVSSARTSGNPATTPSKFRMTNLTGANMTGANLTSAKLKGATMPDGSIHN
jgi:uncharacterized protein YjbI with pentapeptide repeats